MAKTKPKKGATHRFSTHLAADPRISAPPRHVEVLRLGRGPEPVPAPVLCRIKIYGVLGPAGAELMTVSCTDPTTAREYEFRFDEAFAVALRFRSQSDEERVAYAREQIERTGGLKALAGFVRSLFPEFSV